MRKLMADGIKMSAKEQDILMRENLYKSFRDKANIEVGTQFKDRNSDFIIEDALNFIEFLRKNPGSDMLESKPIGNVKFDQLAGALLPDYTSPQALKAALNAGLDPKRTLLFRNTAEPNAIDSRSSMYQYMMHNMPGVAFSEKGDLVTD